MFSFWFYLTCKGSFTDIVCDVEGHLVYVNYGRIEDFNKLTELGIDVKASIAIARYGRIFRGDKVKYFSRPSARMNAAVK